jgi:uncharacterized membrane protein YesL
MSIIEHAILNVISSTKFEYERSLLTFTGLSLEELPTLLLILHFNILTSLFIFHTDIFLIESFSNYQTSYINSTPKAILFNVMYTHATS